MKRRTALLYVIVSCVAGVMILLFGRQSREEGWANEYNYVLHVAAGFILAFFFFGLAACVKPSWCEHSRVRTGVFLLVMCVGVGWEILEYFSSGQGILWMVIGGSLDTALDLICDAAGGIVGLKLITIFQKK